MDYYNYMLIVQQEVLKAIIKKDINIGFCPGPNEIYLAEPENKSVFRIPENRFTLNTSISNMRLCESLKSMFSEATMNGRHVEITPEIVQSGKSLQLRKVINSDNNIETYIDNKFLGYFKNSKNVLYNYFEYRNTLLVSAYDFRTVDVLGVTVTMKPKR